MNDYDLNTTINDLVSLKKDLELAEDPTPILDEFKLKYPFSSSYESVRELLLTTDIDLDIIAKLLISECKKEPIFNNLIGLFDYLN